MASVRRWIEGQTFTPLAGTGGVQLVDTRAAPYGRFRELFIVGLVDGDWPQRPDRSIFYPASLLAPLGWPRQRDRLRTARARFADLVQLPLERVSLSTFSLEDDAVVTPSILLEQVADAGLISTREFVDRGVCVTWDEALARLAVVPDDLPFPAASWLAIRQQRPEREDARFHGVVGPRPTKTYAVKSLEQYLECPFKYFAGSELTLGEEPADESTLNPRGRGLFLHRVLETFFTEWQAAGDGAITLANLDRALVRFRTLAEHALGNHPPGERAVLRTWLLGSAAAPGLAEQLFQMEIGRPAEVVERLVEYRIDGTFTLTGEGSPRAARIRGISDRIDLLSDGTFRVVDYKASRAPQPNRALQLPLYARCAEQQLDGYRDRTWRVGDAAYAAFGDTRLHVPPTSRGLAQSLARGEARAIYALEQIEQGIYPPRPAEVHHCNVCPHPTVCRKDYVGEK